MKNLFEHIRRLKYDRSLTPDPVWKKQTLLLLKQELYREETVRKVHGINLWFERFSHLFSSYRLTPIRVLASFVLVFVLGGSGLTFASQNTIPGDFLYPVKTATEKIQRFIAVTPEQKVAVNTSIAEHRTQELEQLIQKQAPAELINEASENLVNEVQFIIQDLKTSPGIAPASLAASEEKIRKNIVILQKYALAPKVQPQSTSEESLLVQPASEATTVPSEQNRPEPAGQAPITSPSTQPVTEQPRSPVQEPATQRTPIPQDEPVFQPIQKTPVLKSTPQMPAQEPEVASESAARQEIIPLPQPTHQKLVESINELENAHDEVTVTQLKTAPDQSGPAKVEEKIEAVQQKIQIQEQTLNSIVDTKNQQQALELINQAKTQLQESHDKLQEQNLVESFETARKSDKTIEQVKEIQQQAITPPASPPAEKPLEQPSSSTQQPQTSNQPKTLQTEPAQSTPATTSSETPLTPTVTPQPATPSETTTTEGSSPQTSQSPQSTSPTIQSESMQTPTPTIKQPSITPTLPDKKLQQKKDSPSINIQPPRKR